MTTQDLVKGIDLTALSTVTGSEINQQIDTGRVAADKGIIIETTDTALNVPAVPNPDATYIGIDPTWWKRYIWKRNPFPGSADEIKLYVWNTEFINDAIFLFWRDIKVNLLTQTDLTTINDAILAAQTTANGAQTAADLASAQALDAFSIGEDANIALDAFKAFFGTEGQVEWTNILNKPLNVSGVRYKNAQVIVLNVSNPVAFADTGWLFLDLSPFIAVWPDIDSAPNRSAVILEIKVETQLTGASAGFAELDAYISNDDTADPAYLTDARLVTAKARTTSPNDAIGVGQKEIIVALSGTKGIYYRWVSTGITNSFQIYLTGAIYDVTKVA